MSSATDSFLSFSHDKEVTKARWYKDDLEIQGWRVIKERQGSTFWMKTFPGKNIPIKILFSYNMPLSAEQFAQVFSPKNMEYRLKWDRAFVGNEILEEYPDNGGYVVSNRAELSWPLGDREFVLFIPPTKQIEWYGKPALLVACVNAWHPSKPVGRYVRATNGGNFYIAIPDEKDPENKCTIFGLTHNNYNGWLPKTHIQWLLARSVPKAFTFFFECLAQGHKMFFANK